MKILFYDTKSYDREFFEKLLPSYPGIEIKFIEANIHEETASPTKSGCDSANAKLTKRSLIGKGGGYKGLESIL